MRFLAALLLSVPLAMCESEGNMPIPPDHQMVSAADAPPGGPPFDETECPSDKAKAAAADIRRVAAVCLANQRWALSDAVVEYTFTDVPATPFVVGPPNTFSGNTWTDSAVTLDVVGAAVGDDLKVDLWGNWQLNSSSSPGDVVGKLRVEVIEDVAVTPVPFQPDGIAVIYDDGAALSLPHNEPYVLHVRHRITNPGDARVTLQVRSEDIAGGAGTATIILMFSARLDVSHHKRSLTAP